MKDELITLRNRTKQLRDKFEKSYVRSNETSEFKEEFLKKQDQVEILFTSAEDEQDVKKMAKLIADIGNELRTLEKLFSASSMFVLPQVHSMCDDLIWSFEDRLTILKKCHLLNKRVVKEVEKPVVKPVNNASNNNNNNSINSNNANNTVANNNNNTVTPARAQTGTKLIRNTTEFANYKTITSQDKVYTLENLSGVALTLTQRVINSKRVLLNGLSNCCVKINFPLESLQILFCKYCQILVGQVASSIIKNTYSSLISVNGEKVRIECCEGTLFKLPTNCNAVVKESFRLEFANYDSESDKKPEESTGGLEKCPDVVGDSTASNADGQVDNENFKAMCSANAKEIVLTNSAY